MTPVTEFDQALSSHVVAFLEHGLDGEVDRAVGVALRLLDDGVPAHRVVDELLVPVQFEVGERWCRGELTVADEHLVTTSVESALHALDVANTPRETRSQVLLVCAEGEWHASAAHMFSVQLQSRGVDVRFLGASAPARDVARLLERQQPDALVVSCTMPANYPGVTGLVDAAHSVGLPVLVGGRAFVRGPDLVHRLGGDAWAPDTDGAVTILEGWRQRPPSVAGAVTPLPAAAVELGRQAEELSVAACHRLEENRRRMTDRERFGLALRGEEVASMVRVLAAAQLVECDAVFADFLDWTGRRRAARDSSPSELKAELDAIVPFLGSFPRSFADVLLLGAARLDEAV